MATDKQLKAIKEITENHRSVSMAMKEAEYAKNTYTKPKNLTESKAYKEILGKRITEDELAEKHREFIHSENEMVGIKGLDMAYKVNGSYAPDKVDNRSVNVNINIDNEYLDKLADKIDAEIDEEDNQASDGTEDSSLDEVARDKE